MSALYAAAKRCGDGAVLYRFAIDRMRGGINGETAARALTWLGDSPRRLAVRASEGSNHTRRDKPARVKQGTVSGHRPATVRAMKPAAAIVSLLNRWSPRMVFEAIRRQLGRSVPFARLLGIEVDGIDAQHARTRLDARAELCNHAGTVHAGALFTVCESASGAALAGAMADIIMRTRFVVRDAQVEYLRPAKGCVLAKAMLADEAAVVLQALRQDGHCDVAVDVSAVTVGDDGAETQVVRASFNWHLRLLAG